MAETDATAKPAQPSARIEREPVRHDFGEVQRPLSIVES